MLPNSNTDFLPLIQEDDFLPPISRWTTFGGLFIVAVVLLAIPIASVTKYKITVQSQASVRPVGELRLVQAVAEGSIMRISVKENQSVKKGNAIAFIDDSRLQTKKLQLQNSIRQERLQLVQIQAQISALNGQIGAESDRINRTVTSAKAELSNRQRDYRDKQITSNAEVQEAEADLRGAQEEWQKGRAELTSIQANLNSTKAALKAAKSKQHRYQRVAREGALSQDQLEEAQLAVKQQEQAVESQKANVESQLQAIERLEQSVRAAQARHKRIQTALNPSQAEVSIATERIAQEKATGTATLATLTKERSALIGQRIEIDKQLAENIQELKQVNFDLEQTTITATADGIISKLNLRNPGQTVSSGEEIAQIIPKNAPLEVKAAVSPQDIGKLKVGQKVIMRISACPYPDYGTLDGTVSQIAKDTIKLRENNEPATVSPKVFYETTISPENLILSRGKHQCPIQLGMEGRADIVTKEETVLQFLLRKARLMTDL